MVDRCPAEKLLDYFFEFVGKANLDLRLMLHTRLDGRNVNLKYWGASLIIWEFQTLTLRKIP